MKKVLRVILTTTVVVVLLAGLAVYAHYRAFLEAPLAVAERGTPLTVKPGTSIADIAGQLEHQGVLRSGLSLRVYARVTGMASRIQAGEYLIEPGTRPYALLEQLVEGRVVQYSLTIVEGWTFQQMLAAVHDHEKLDHTLKDLDEKEIMVHLGYPGEHPEGRFFPDTYHFPAGTSDVAFLQRAYETMEQRLSQAWERRPADLPLRDPYEALILASIVEKETGLDSERREIAGVFTRRLQKGMLLQTDPTVIYGLGEKFNGKLSRRDLKTDTPYNTYTRPGLPPTPIALPGTESIAAAVNPASGVALFFVADGNGGHVFSTTLSEHNRAVKQYRRKQR